MKHKKIILCLLVLVFSLFCVFINASYSIYRENQPDSIDLSVLDPNTNFIVYFEGNGGTSSEASRTRTYNQAIGSPLPTAQRDGYNFVGWYTDPADGVEITSQTVVTGTVHYYAHWVKIVCKKAVAGTLHSETCISDGACAKSGGGYSANDTIYYGTIPGVSSPIVGDAYDCDVNDDGVWDSATERFYYVRSYGTTDPDENSVLVHYTSFDENGQMDSSKTRGSYVYDTALTYLPTSSTWDNSALISMNGNVTRFISRQDLSEACVTNNNTIQLGSCPFFLENSRFQSKELGRAGIWIEKEGNSLYRIQSETLTVGTAPDVTSINTARPVIQIPSNTIEDFKIGVQYAIHFDAKGGESVADYQRYAGEELGTLPTTTKTGFTFGGWYTEDVNYTTQVTEHTVVSGEVTYYAKWIPNVRIDFDANGGTVSPLYKEVGTGLPLGELPIPVYIGHNFEGWFTDRDTGVEVTEQTLATAATTYFAHWSVQENELEYVFRIPGECTFTSSGLTNGTNGNCISTINPTGVEIDYTESTLSAKKYIDTGIGLYNTTNHDKDYEIGFTIVDYTPGSNVDRATLFNSKAEINTTTMKYPGVVFRRNNSTSDFLLQSRNTLSANEEYTVASADVTDVKIYRTDDAIYYSINGGTKTKLNDLDQYNPVFDLTAWFGAAPSNANATSAQRFFTGTLSNLYIKLAGEETADLTFDLNYQGAPSPTTRTVYVGSQVGELTSPTRSGFTFAGWFTDPTDGTQITSNTVVNADMYCYAHWYEDVTITLHANGGQLNTNTITVPYGTTVGSLLETPTQSGYVFDGWYEEPEFETLVTSQTVVTSNVDYYANWIQAVTVTYHANGGTVSPASKDVAINTAVGELAVPERTGYTFEGWYSEPELQNLVTSATVIASDIDLYANWIEDVTVTFNAMGGTASFNTKTIPKGSAIGELPTATQASKRFDGWFEEEQCITPVTTATVVSSTTVFYAKWTTLNYVAEVGGTQYESLALAIDAVPTTGVKTTVTLLTDITTTETTTIPGNRWVELDIGQYTLSTTSGTYSMLTNNGKLDIINGTLTSSAGYIIETKSNSITNISGGTLTYDNASDSEHKVIETKGGTVNISGGTLTCNSKAAAINVNENSTLNVSGGIIKGSNTYKGQAIYNNKGTTNISGTAYLENVSANNANGRAALHNNAGTVTITGGTIVSKGNAAVKNNDVMTIGTDDGTIDTTSPVMQGHSYGLETVSGKTVTIYDGIFKGKVSTNNLAISDETVASIGNYQFSHGTETIDSVQYVTAYLTNNVASVTVTFVPGTGATVSPVSKTFTSGTAIGALPTPEKTGFTFDGWYTAASDGTLVDANTTFSNSDSIYAHWSENITLNFNVNGGTSVEYNSKSLTSAGAVGTLPTATKTNSEFLGWFTAASGGERLLPTTEVTSSDNGNTYYAHYTNATTVCRPATTLHTDGNTSFGQIHSGSSLSAGDAFDCDVNGDGTFDATNERFYYLTDNITGKAVFIYSNNTHDSGNGVVGMCKPDAVAYASDFTHGPNTAVGELPTTTDWPNVNIYSEPRTITNEAGTTIVNNYLYTEKAARFATVDEIKAATTSTLNSTTNELASYTFLLENTASYGDCRSNYWLESPYSGGGAYRIDGASANKKLGHATGSSGIRPVIEVPYASIDGITNIVEFDTIPTAMRTYFNNVSTWNAGQDDSNYSSFNSSMLTNLTNNNCAYYLSDNTGTQYGSVYCDQPNKYDTGTTGNINVYEYNETLGVRSNTTADYVSNDNGLLYNFIPGKVYYWESAADSTVNGYVRPTGERRLITIPGTTRMTRNVRDLGGLPVDTDGDGTIDGKTKFAKIYRGEKIWGTNRNGVTRAQFEKLGIYNEVDLRTPGEEVASEEDKLTNYTSNEIIHYKIDHTEFGSPATEARFNGKSYYQLARDAAIDVMQKVVAGNDDYALFFHCRIGADRTGTLAYILEGLLGVPTEYRHRDYELTTFFGLRERTRYYLNKDSNNYKFIYLKKAIRHATPNNNEITGEENVMDWFLLEGNSTTECNDITALINQFRAKMIDYN